MRHRATLIYDRDCGFCRWALAKVLAWDRRGAIRALALQDAEAEQLLGDMDVERRAQSWHLVLEDGRRLSAGVAVAPLLRLLPGGRAPGALADAFPGLTDRAYAFVARHRSTLGRILGTGT